MIFPGLVLTYFYALLDYFHFMNLRLSDLILLAFFKNQVTSFIYIYADRK